MWKDSICRKQSVFVATKKEALFVKPGKRSVPFPLVGILWGQLGQKSQLFNDQ